MTKVINRHESLLDVLVARGANLWQTKTRSELLIFLFGIMLFVILMTSIILPLIVLHPQDSQENLKNPNLTLPLSDEPSPGASGSGLTKAYPQQGF